MSPPAKRVTIRDVADAAGVSPAAVSYALRGIQVSEETQERVRKVATDLGYEANPIARALASGRTGMVGILGPSLEDLWQQRLVAEAGRVAAGARALRADPRRRRRPDAPADARHPAARPAGRRADPLAGRSVRRRSGPSSRSRCRSSRSATPCRSRGAVGEVLFDNRTGVRSALEHLHGLGHRRIAVLRPPGSPTNDRPAEVYVGAEADRLGLDVDVVSAPYELERGDRRRPRGAEPARIGPPPFSASRTRSPTASTPPPGSWSSTIPDDLSVIGYDDHPVSILLAPPLTSFSWDTERLVEVAVGMVLAAIDGHPRRRRRVVIEPAPARARLDRPPRRSPDQGWRAQAAENRRFRSTRRLPEERDQLARHPDRVVVGHQEPGRRQGSQLGVGSRSSAS